MLALLIETQVSGVLHHRARGCTPRYDACPAEDANVHDPSALEARVSGVASRNTTTAVTATLPAGNGDPGSRTLVQSGRWRCGYPPDDKTHTKTAPKTSVNAQKGEDDEKSMSEKSREVVMVQAWISWSMQLRR
jgi:hypothetical protein